MGFAPPTCSAMQFLERGSRRQPRGRPRADRVGKPQSQARDGATPENNTVARSQTSNGLTGPLELAGDNKLASSEASCVRRSERSLSEGDVPLPMAPRTAARRLATYVPGSHHGDDIREDSTSEQTRSLNWSAMGLVSMLALNGGREVIHA